MSQAILGIDPVRQVRRGGRGPGGTCHCREVVPTSDVVPVVQRLSTAYPVVRIVIGDGTGSEALIQAFTRGERPEADWANRLSWTKPTQRKRKAAELSVGTQKGLAAAHSTSDSNLPASPWTVM